ncbi:GRF1-interacting factor 3, partial [Nymphaea thermarum]
CLDENKQLILAILENQNLGKVADVVQLQNRLQQNLIYLAAIADAQPQLQALQLAQGLPHSATQAGEGHFMQHPQAMGATQQHPFPPRVPMQFSSPQQMQEHQHHQQHIQQQMLHQQQQFAQSPFGMRPGSSNGVRPEVALGASSAAQQLSAGTMLVGSSSNNPMENMQTAGGLTGDAQGNKQEAGATGSDNQSGNGPRSSTSGIDSKS